MLDYKNILLPLLLLSLCFSCTSYASQGKKHEIDELINQSTLAIVKNDYVNANNILVNLLVSGDTLTFGQEVNIYYKLLELTFVNKDYNKSKEYGYKLYNLIKSNDKYHDVKMRLVFRLCESEDWAITRDSFNDICKKHEVKPK